MTELTSANSFIIRVYRFDTEDLRKLTGLVESMDGSSRRQPFTDIDELAALLGRSVVKLGGRRKNKIGKCP
jgi:hypothetical protein